MSSFIKELRQDPRLKFALDEIKKSRPIVPQYQPEIDNVREIVAKSCEQKGFDLAISLLVGE